MLQQAVTHTNVRIHLTVKCTLQISMQESSSYYQIILTPHQTIVYNTIYYVPNMNINILPMTNIIYFDRNVEVFRFLEVDFQIRLKTTSIDGPARFGLWFLWRGVDVLFPLPQMAPWLAPCTTSPPQPAPTPTATPSSRPSRLPRATTSSPTRSPSTRPCRPTPRATACRRPPHLRSPPTTSPVQVPRWPSTCPRTTRASPTTSRPWAPRCSGSTSTRCCRGWRCSGAG